MDKVFVGPKLRQLRKHHKHTQAELGKLIGVSAAYVNLLENNQLTGTVPSHLAFIIGGADGIDPSLRVRADMSISFGSMVWPHMLVRVMLSEQLYRAASILAGSPYHRA